MWLKVFFCLVVRSWSLRKEIFVLARGTVRRMRGALPSLALLVRSTYEHTSWRAVLSW